MRFHRLLEPSRGGVAKGNPNFGSRDVVRDFHPDQDTFLFIFCLVDVYVDVVVAVVFQSYADSFFF